MRGAPPSGVGLPAQEDGASAPRELGRTSRGTAAPARPLGRLGGGRGAAAPQASGASRRFSGERSARAYTSGASFFSEQRTRAFTSGASILTAPPLLDIRTILHHKVQVMVSEKIIGPLKRTCNSSLKHTGKVFTYPDGTQDIVVSTSADFSPSGWEIAEDYRRSGRTCDTKKERKTPEPQKEDIERAMRRARGKLRRLALSNDFRWFVTLTIDPKKVDSHDGAAVVRKLNAWCSNMVQRKGLKYILVPERHKKGGIHFHGFFNDCLDVVDSGHKDRQGHVIYNLPQWALGFTTAIELYDDYTKAVGYVCKYVGKQGDKPAGRWYYSGGALNQPSVTYVDLDWREVVENYGEKCFSFSVAGKQITVCNGIKSTGTSTKKEDT